MGVLAEASLLRVVRIPFEWYEGQPDSTRRRGYCVMVDGIEVSRPYGSWVDANRALGKGRFPEIARVGLVALIPWNAL